MPSILDTLDPAFRAAIHAAFGLDADPLIAPSANPQFGDYQSNAAMGLAKRVAEQTGAKTNPRQIAEQIKAKLDLGTIASDVSIAGPGFLNVRLNPAWLAEQLNVSASDEQLGVPRAPSPQTVVVDYSAPNVAKEMHVGHLRSTIIGDCFARTLAFLGHHVIRQNHIGDWGTQFGMLIAYARDHTDFVKVFEHTQTSIPGLKSSGSSTHMEVNLDVIKDLEGFYREAKKRFDSDEQFKEEARATVVRLQNGSPFEDSCWDFIVRTSKEYFEKVYRRLGVQLVDRTLQEEEIEVGESFYNDRLPRDVNDLVRAGIAVPSDGAFVTFAAGYEAPLIVQKSDGGFGYATTDLAAIRYRVGTLHANRIIYVVGAPQSQHFAQVFDVARRAGWAGEAFLEHAAFGSVLGEDGKLFRTRTGGTVKLVDLLDEAERRALELVTKKNEEAPDDRKLPTEALPAIAHAVGIGAVKYFDLLRDRVGDYKFSFDAMLAMDGNTAPYLQYAYARIRSIFRKTDPGVPASAGLTVTTLTEPQELTLAKTLLRFSASVETVARELKPHVLCTYLYDLAGAFSAFYDACQVLKSEEPARSSRLALCDLTARTIAQGLDLLGIEHPEQM